ncbi:MULTISPECIES: LOG family protein [Gluconobacter]|uniref:Cytokinin riboside 5'-monophosphate phosphoribohydrolase n=1 Tax=Gluconobacter cadivus TaxID=2728101 RepID=A0ABR9YRK3_9PROT|nr:MULTISPECIES: TIGR00730 family Rossman fold protein [Gluconobacter]MBF0887160.1 TIGR00730 family Rossman fold protein [Gluconobacter cadivus]MBS1059229.1 TIGR00730 family Rossman fold protein [Gluconobacter sp. Dm-44]
MIIRSCAVFCGSRFGNSPAYAEGATEIGTALAQHGITLVYGGGHVGLMGTVADAALKAGGRVIGVIPEFLHAREVMHKGVTQLEVTPDMHTRKARMFELSDAYAIIPGGLGTFDELMEIMTWKQLGLHQEPIYIVNIGGWATSLVDTLNAAVDQGFADPSARRLFKVVQDVPELMEHLSVNVPA